MVSFTTEAVANQVYERRHMLDKHPYMDSVYIMKDLPRSERANRRASNTLNEAANSGGNGAQNLRGGNGSTGSVGNGATLPRNQSSTNNNNGVREESGAVNNTENRNGVEERDNEDRTEASTENLAGIVEDSAGGTTGDASEPVVHPTETTTRIGVIGSSEQQSAGGNRGAEGSIERRNNSGNEGVGERVRGS